MVFERRLLKLLLALYDRVVSSGQVIPKEVQEDVKELQKAFNKPHKMFCYVSDGICCYSLSPHQTEKCVGFSECSVAIAKKAKEREIVFR